MAGSSDGEFNPWPAFVDIFSAVILVMLLLLMVVLANLGYFAQFKYKVSYSGAVSSDDIIRNNNKTTEEDVETTQTSSASAAAITNSDRNVQIISEQKQMILALQKQLSADPNNTKSAKGSDEIESAGINVADKRESTVEVQKMVTAEEYIIVNYKADELFVDDVITKQIKQFLETTKNKYKTFQVVIYSSDIKDQLSSTISKQISLGRTMSVRNLIKKFGYDKKDIKIDLANKPVIKETVDATNGYIVIRIEK